MTLAHAVADPAMTHLGYPREALDFYPTIDRDLTRVLLPVLAERFPGAASVWECAAGDGRMLDVLRQVFPAARGSDYRPGRSDIFRLDFLSAWVDPVPDLIVTNPPYVLGDEFVERCIEYVKAGAHAFLLMRNEFDCAGSSMRSGHLAGPLFRGKFVLRWRPRWVEGSTGSPRHNYAWYWFGPGNEPAAIRYLDRPRHDRPEAPDGDRPRPQAGENGHDHGTGGVSSVSGLMSPVL